MSSQQNSPAEATVGLKVPRGLWLFLEKMQPSTGDTPKERLETVLTNKLECILGNLDDSMFDLKLIRTRY